MNEPWVLNEILFMQYSFFRLIIKVISLMVNSNFIFMWNYKCILQMPISIIITLWFLIVLNPWMNPNRRVKGVTYPPSPDMGFHRFYIFLKNYIILCFFNYYYYYFFLIDKFKYYTLHIKIYFLKLFNFYACLVHCC